MNNLISDANELLKQYAITGDRDFFIDAINKILAQIATAISPLNPMNRPFIAAVMMRYVDFIKKDFDVEEMKVFYETLRCLGNTGAEHIITMPMPNKGEK